jgi:hypothetical protein
MHFHFVCLVDIDPFSMAPKSLGCQSTHICQMLVSTKASCLSLELIRGKAVQGVTSGWNGRGRGACKALSRSVGAKIFLKHSKWHLTPIRMAAHLMTFSWSVRGRRVCQLHVMEQICTVSCRINASMLHPHPKKWLDTTLANLCPWMGL